MIKKISIAFGIIIGIIAITALTIALIYEEQVKKNMALFSQAMQMFSPFAYGAVGMLRDAITRAGSTGREKIRAALAPIKDPPRASGSFTVNTQRNPAKPAYIVASREGRYRFLGIVRP